MKLRISALFFCLQLALSLSAADLSTAPPEELLRLYQQLRSLQGSDQGAVAENVDWKRDAATFTFIDGRLTFAEPVAGHVVAAVFEGRGHIELKPPTEIEHHQLARHTKIPELVDEFEQAVFFFTDDSWSQLQQLVRVGGGADAAAATKVLTAAQRKYSERFNDWWENRHAGNPLMRNLAARILADLSDPSSRGFFLADFKAQHAGSLLYHISWNRDPLLLPEASNDEEVQLIHYDLKGAYVLEMLRVLLEDPKLREPDQRFIETLRDFAATYASENASTEDFRKIVEKHCGQPMDWFFNEWVYSREVPHYDFHYNLKDGGGGKTTLEYSLKQSDVSDQFSMRVPVYGHVNGQPRRLGFIAIKGPREVQGEVPLPLRPERVTLDEFHSILCTVSQ